MEVAARVVEAREGAKGAGATGAETVAAARAVVPAEAKEEARVAVETVAAAVATVEVARAVVGKGVEERAVAKGDVTEAAAMVAATAVVAMAADMVVAREAET